MNITASTLSDWSAAILIGAGLTESAAQVVADSLVEANLRGVDSHGVLRLAVYVQRLRAGLLNPDPRPSIITQNGAVAMVEADHGPGQVAGVYGVDLATDLAREHGVGVVGVRSSAHYGAAAYYAMRAAEKGFLAFCATNVEPDVVPHGGSKSALGTNPLAFAAKAPQGIFVLDMATSQVAMGKVFLAREKNEEIPEGWAVDEEGRSTTDPHEATAVLPLGGPKGYGLAIMVEVLSAVFTGAGLTHAVGRMYDDWDQPQDVGHFSLVLDPEKGIGRDLFTERMGQLWQSIKATPAAPGFEEVLIPGELEDGSREERMKHGIPLSDAVYADLTTMSEELGVPVPVQSSG